MKTLLLSIVFAISSSALAGHPCPDPEDFTCRIRTGCMTPWGEHVDDGDSVVAFLYSSASTRSECVSEIRSCYQGALSGSYQHEYCDAAADSGLDTFK